MKIVEKKILVTGGDGFIGSHLVESLVKMGCQVKAFVMYNSFNSWGWLDNLPKEDLSKLEIISGDIRDYNAVYEATKDVEVIFHLAALIAIPYSYVAPDSYVDTNVKGTLNILQAAKQRNVQRVLVTSTSEVYGTAKYVPIDEIHPKQGQSPYSATKISADYLSQSFYLSFELPVTIVRPFNTYGPRQSARAVIPTIITQLLDGNEQIKLGSLHPTRDLLFVKDTVNGFIKIAECEELVGEEVNIATNSEISIKNLVNELIKQINSKATVSLDSNRLRPTNSEVDRLYGCNKKIKKFTDWNLDHTLEEGLKETIDWFRLKENLKFYKSDIYNI